MKLTEYAKLVRIKMPDGNYRGFTPTEIEELGHMEEMISKGYHLTLVKGKYTRAAWVKLKEEE